ncbi:MAG: TetR/AcrR family transcriptional regulator [Desulfobacterales bacterium]|jgi:AcrR family transcriptional regulator
MSPARLQTFLNLPKEKQERILRVALEEFSQNGYERTSINTIVKRLGIAKGSIFQYFQGKENLFLHLFTIALETVKTRLKQVRDDSVDRTFFERLDQTLDAGVRFINDHPAIYRLYLSVLFESRMPFRQEILSSIRHYSHDFLKGLIDTGVERGELRKDIDPDIAAFALDAILDRFLQAQCIDHLDAGLGLFCLPEASTRRWITGIVDMVAAGLGRPEGR